MSTQPTPRAPTRPASRSLWRLLVVAATLLGGAGSALPALAATEPVDACGSCAERGADFVLDEGENWL